MIWDEYINYLQEWAVHHKDVYFFGMSPAGFDEWLTMEKEWENFYLNEDATE